LGQDVATDLPVQPYQLGVDRACGSPLGLPDPLPQPLDHPVALAGGDSLDLRLLAVGWKVAHRLPRYETVRTVETTKPVFGGYAPDT
jgi:hypothetical protein